MCHPSTRHATSSLHSSTRTSHLFAPATLSASRARHKTVQRRGSCAPHAMSSRPAVAYIGRLCRRHRPLLARRQLPPLLLVRRLSESRGVRRWRDKCGWRESARARGVSGAGRARVAAAHHPDRQIVRDERAIPQKAAQLSAEALDPFADALRAVREDAVLSPVCNLGPGQTRSRGRPPRHQPALLKPRLHAADLAPPVEVAEMEKVHELHAPLLLVREAPARTPPARARRRCSVTVDRVVGALDARVGGGLGGHHIGGGRLPRAGVVGRGGPGVAGVKTAARAPPSSRRRGGVGSNAGGPPLWALFTPVSYQKKGKDSTSAARELGTASGHPGGHLGTRGAKRRGPGNISTPGPLTGVALLKVCG